MSKTQRFYLLYPAVLYVIVYSQCTIIIVYYIHIIISSALYLSIIMVLQVVMAFVFFLFHIQFRLNFSTL